MMRISTGTLSTTAGSTETFRVTFALCDICNKRYYNVENGLDECDYCMTYYWDMKCYRCDFPSFIIRKWLRICYKLKVPYKLIRFLFRGGR